MDVQAAVNDTPSLRVFINYRRSEAQGYALLLYENFAARFGPDNVFLDLKSIDGGRKWLDEIRSSDSGCTAFILLMGGEWEEIMLARARSPEPDYVREEIELALRAASRSAGVVIVPALLDEAKMPNEQALPQPLRPILMRQAVPLRSERWDADVDALVAAIEKARSAPPSTPAEQVEAPPVREPSAPVASLPGDDHYEKLVAEIEKDKSVVIFLGPGANSSDREEPWADAASGCLPDGDELAVYLAEQFGVKAEPALLAQVSQYAAIATSRPELDQFLRATLLAARPEPTSVHQFLARVPRFLHDAGKPERYQMIVSTNYDNALEQAFREEEEPFDLAVYMAKEGRFVHFPYDGEPKPIEIGRANEYSEFPINPITGALSRSVIVKIHGAVDGEEGPIAWKDNYVITEDDYICFLSQAGAASIIPVQIRSKLIYGPFLFLGYTMRDWNLRVFLNRSRETESMPRAWAVQRDPNPFDVQFWDKVNVALRGMPLDEYVRELEAYLRVPAMQAPA